MKAKKGVVLVIFARYSNQFYRCRSFFFSPCICGLNYLRIFVGGCVCWGWEWGVGGWVWVLQMSVCACSCYSFHPILVLACSLWVVVFKFYFFIISSIPYLCDVWRFVAFMTKECPHRDNKVVCMPVQRGHSGEYPALPNKRKPRLLSQRSTDDLLNCTREKFQGTAIPLNCAWC